MESSLLAEAVALFPSWRAALFLSLKRPQSPGRWGQISNRQGSSQHSVRAIPAPPAPHSPSPKPPPSLLLAREECVASQGYAGSRPTAWLRDQNHLAERGKSGRCLERGGSPRWHPALAGSPGAGQGSQARTPRGWETLARCLSNWARPRIHATASSLLLFARVSSRDFWDSLVSSGSQGSWEKR